MRRHEILRLPAFRFPFYFFVIASVAKQSSVAVPLWIASSRSLSSGRALRADPLAPRNDAIFGNGVAQLGRDRVARTRSYYLRHCRT
jgi:hypothetical protein